MRFLRSESGALLPFTLIISGVIILAGALAVNTVRVEHKRSVTQSVLDICVLNAAAQRQTLEPRTVFDDCLEKHNFDAVITDFQAATGREKFVTASASLEVESFFLQDPVTYEVGVASEARETLSNLEIVLALDVSASMNQASPVSINPLEDLKAAARSFVDQMLTEDTQGNVKIAIVPYNSMVNLGATLANEFNLTDAPVNIMNGATRIGPDVTQQRCPELPADSYGSTAISTTAPLSATPFVDMLGSTNQTNVRTAQTSTTFAIATLQENLCSFFRLNPSPATNNVVFPPDFGFAALGTPAQRISALQAKINAFVATSQTTSINLAMRWALAFLDPAMQDAYAGLRENNLMPPSTIGHPRPFTDQSAIKVIVLMSDGTNADGTAPGGPSSGGEPRLNPAYVSGPSPFWIGNDNNISWHNPLRAGTDQYWVPHVPAPAGSPSGTAPGAWQAMPWQNATNTGLPARQMDWREVWRRMKLRYVAWEFHARSVNQATGTTVAQRAANNAARQAAFDAALADYMPPALRVTAATKDTQLTQACNLARANNIYVYSILFETFTTNSPTLQACARDASMFYRAATPGALSQAFNEIALNISLLQLDQ